MPSQQHDPCARHCEPDQSGVQEVRRGLVDEMTAAAAQRGHRVEVTAADRGQVGLRTRLARRGRRSVAAAHDRERQFAEFAEALHGRVRGQDPVDQCRAAAGQADHEDGTAARPVRRCGAQSLCVEVARDRRHQRRISVDAVLVAHAARARAARQPLHRARVLALVLEFLVQRIAVRRQVGRCRGACQFLEAGDVVVLGGPGTHPGERVPGLGVRGPALRERLEPRGRLLQIADCSQRARDGERRGTVVGRQ